MYEIAIRRHEKPRQMSVGTNFGQGTVAGRGLQLGIHPTTPNNGSSANHSAQRWRLNKRGNGALGKDRTRVSECFLVLPNHLLSLILLCSCFLKSLSNPLNCRFLVGLLGGLMGTEFGGKYAEIG
ncbi:MAG: hypothetical protein AAFO80_12230 [Pseudomonadota bacterium]